MVQAVLCITIIFKTDTERVIEYLMHRHSPMRAALRKEWCPMFERALFILAALATIGAFLIEAWRTWKDCRESRKRSNDLENKSGQ